MNIPSKIGPNWPSGFTEYPETTASHWQTLSHNIVSSTPRLSGIRAHNFHGTFLYINTSRLIVWPNLAVLHMIGQSNMMKLQVTGHDPNTMLLEVNDSAKKTKLNKSPWKI